VSRPASKRPREPGATASRNAITPLTSGSRRRLKALRASRFPPQPSAAPARLNTAFGVIGDVVRRGTLASHLFRSYNNVCESSSILRKMRQTEPDTASR